MDGRWYRARWSLPNGKPTYSEIWAQDKLQAREIALALDFDVETVAAVNRPVFEYRPSKLAQAPGGFGRPDVLHSLCYLSTLAGRAGLLSAEKAVEDESPLHELGHYLQLGPNVRGGAQRQFLLERCRWLESIIPGMPPDELVMEIQDAPGGPWT